MPKNRTPQNRPKGQFEENPQWTAEKFARSLRFDQLPEHMQRALGGVQGQPSKTPAEKVNVPINLSKDVFLGLRATGRGWQKRADDALRDWLKQQSKTKANNKAAA